MDILSIIALGKANKALKNGGGGTAESPIVFYDFEVTSSGGTYTVSTEANWQDIRDDVDTGKIPYARISFGATKKEQMPFAFYDDGGLYFTLVDGAVNGITVHQLLHYHLDDMEYWAYENYFYQKYEPSE